MTDAAGMDAAAAGLEELAGLVSFRVGAWRDFGYAEPPAPGCAAIPPLGERSASAIEAGHEAVGDIDRLIARLHQVRAQLVSELRQDEDIRAARADALLAERKEDGEADVFNFCSRCRRAVSSVSCVRCGGLACVLCGRCPDCDGDLPGEEE